MNYNYQNRKVGDLEIVELPGNPDLGTILLFHGFGADAYDLAPISSLYNGPSWIFPQGPLKIPILPGYYGRAWFDIDIELLRYAQLKGHFDEVAKAFPPELTQAREIVDELILQLDISRSKLILGGFSQGAVLALEVALNGTHSCAALLILSGTLVNESNWRRLAPQHANTSFFQSHGFEDPLLPMKKAEDLQKLLIESGWKGKLYPFHGGHEIPQNTQKQIHDFLQKIFK